jgi:hypothetical protein
MQISLCFEDICVFQRMYADKSETVDWMSKFGSPLDKMIGGLIKQANEGKTEIVVSK